MKKHLLIICSLLLLVTSTLAQTFDVQITSPADGSRIPASQIQVGILFSTTDPVPAFYNLIAYDNGSLWTYGGIQLVTVQEATFSISYQTKVHGSHLLQVVVYNDTESVTNSITVYR